MKIQNLFTLLLLIVMGCACGKIEQTKHKIYPIPNQIVEDFLLAKIPLSGVKSDYFSPFESDYVYVINSEKEFKEIFGNEISIQFDFEKYTLLLGQKRMPNSLYTIKEQYIEKDDKGYSLHLKAFLPDAFYPAFSWLYYWGVYPKIDKNIKVFVHTNY